MSGLIWIYSEKSNNIKRREENFILIKSGPRLHTGTQGSHSVLCDSYIYAFCSSYNLAAADNLRQDINSNDHD